MLRTIAIAATALCVACPSPRPVRPAPTTPDDRALRITVARAEARRAGGVAELVQLVQSPDPHARALAVRGLGRIGGADALRAVVAATGDASPEVVTAALGAIGVAASLDDPPYFTLEATPILARLASEPAAIEALGRAGDASAQAILVDALGKPGLAEVAALSLGRHGRRKIALSPAARTALVQATRSTEPRVRYAAVYALAREHEPPADDAVIAALKERLKDPSAETRAQAVAGLVKRKANRVDELVAALSDGDWRVQIEGVRAVAGDEVGRSALADHVGPNGQGIPEPVIEEGLRQLVAHGKPSDFARTVLAKSEPSLTGYRGCFARVILGKPIGELRCDGMDLAILGDAIKASTDDAWRRAATRALLESPDVRLRAAGLDALVAVDEHAAAPQIVAALASKDPVLAGGALDACDDHFAGEPTIEAALLERAARETDPELSSDLYAQIGKRKLAAGADACRAGLTGSAVRARAAAECLRQLGDAVPPPPIGEAAAPPVDVTAVIGKHVRWHLDTTRGAIDIELAPDVAPWNVAMIVALTNKGFYDGLAFHRVVADFVVQGGDPTQSGWGGPGFTTPAEPATLADGPGFVEGGVGIADAGRDSGGSQFFLMHSRAPHLDGRYTWIGHVISGQRAVDALRVGDRVVRATVDLR